MCVVLVERDEVMLSSGTWIAALDLQVSSDEEIITVSKRELPGTVALNEGQEEQSIAS
jgi:hypothetical protein